MTPEGKVKKKVSALLKKYEPELAYHMPVLSGYGSAILDYVVCCCGVFFLIETKAPGGVPTDRQRFTIESYHQAGAVTFISDGSDESLRAIQDHIETIFKYSSRNPE